MERFCGLGYLFKKRRVNTEPQVEPQVDEHSNKRAEQMLNQLRKEVRAIKNRAGKAQEQQQFPVLQQEQQQKPNEQEEIARSSPVEQQQKNQEETAQSVTEQKHPVPQEVQDKQEAGLGKPNEDIDRRYELGILDETGREALRLLIELTCLVYQQRNGSPSDEVRASRARKITQLKKEFHSIPSEQRPWRDVYDKAVNSTRMVFTSRDAKNIYEQAKKNFLEKFQLEKAKWLEWWINEAYNMLDDDCHHDKVAVFKFLIGALCEVGRIVDARNVLKMMLERSCVPDVVIYTQLIVESCRTNALDEARKLIETMEGSGLTPDAVAYNALISGLVKQNQLEEASGLLEEMLQAGRKPDTLSYGAVVDYLSRSFKFEEALRIVEKMKSRRGSHRVPPRHQQCAPPAPPW